MAVFLYAFAKNERENLSAVELKHYKTAAREILAMTPEMLARMLGEGSYVEVKRR